MKIYLTALGLTALNSLQAVPKVEGSRFARVPVSSTASINNPMDNDITALALRSPAEAGLERSRAVPHDVPSHPHCTYKGADSLMYMVFSKDFGRNDETSQDGCGNHMLLHLREGTLVFAATKHRLVFRISHITSSLPKHICT